MKETLLKHWTEPRGTLIVSIPMDWQYRNPVVEPRTEEPPYSFELYENSVGCFQLSCYPLSELAPKIAQSAKQSSGGLKWTRSQMNSEKFDTYIYFGAMDDQALIGKYIYERELRGNPRVAEQLKLVDDVLASIVVIPVRDRVLAANLDKYDRFLGALRASYDLLYAAMAAGSSIEIVVLSTNQIDALLRLGIVLARQLESESDDIDPRYLFQGNDEKGILERTIFKQAFDLGIIDAEVLNKLNDVYDLRNRIVHRYIISPIKTRDMIPIVKNLLELHDVIRTCVRKIEDSQIGKSFGIYGHGFERVEAFDDVEVTRANCWANDKHDLKRFRNKISREEN